MPPKTDINRQGWETTVRERALNRALALLLACVRRRAINACMVVGETAMRPQDFPILCETCLGDNPYVRMVRERAER